MIKAVFFDVDGTLVSFKTQRIPESSKNAIRILQDNGVKVFLATGRHILSIPDMEGLEFDGYININGGLCLLGDKSPIYKHSVSKKDLKAMIELQKTDPFPVLIMDDNGLFINYMTPEVDKIMEMNLFPGVEIRLFEQALDESIYQMVSFISEEKESDVLPLLTDCESLRWHPEFTDIVPKGSSKAVGIDKMIAHFGINLHETMALGDGGNDIAMLKHVNVGVVMGNAAEDVKAAADYVTDSVDDDGVWNALKHFGLI